jgi:NAD(P)-dependent dehydrogenase (short-subunit alcohol dehydrogenase family)
MKDYSPTADLLKKRVILVTGAGDGIGRAVATACAKHGATVILLGKTIPKLEQVYDTIEAAGAPEPAIYPMHLEGAAPHDFEELAAKLEETFGRLDGLVHCAASLPYLARLNDYETDDWMKVMQVNLNAPFMLTQACLPLLKKSEDASVVFTSDSVGREAKAYWGAYAASKAGLETVMKMLAEESEEHTNIRSNSFDPGPTRTKLRKKVFPGQDLTQAKPPEAVANDYLWLLGPDSKDVSGQALSYQED